MYRGEALRFTLRGDAQYPLTDIDFKLYIYPDGCPSNTYSKTKEQCTEQEDGSYLCTFSGAETAALPLGSYSIEIHDSTNQCIFVRRHSFPVETSASSEDINNTGNGSNA